MRHFTATFAAAFAGVVGGMPAGPIGSAGGLLAEQTAAILRDLYQSWERGQFEGAGGTILVSPEDRPEWRRMAVKTNADLVSLDFSPITGDAYVVGGIQEGVVVGTPSRIALLSHDLREWRELRLPQGPD